MNSDLSRSGCSVLAQSRAVLTRTVFQRKDAALSLEQQLWLQAVVDRELPAAEFTRQPGAPPAGAKAQLLLEELRVVKSVLARNEMERRVPRSRDDYWSGIQRAILERAGTAPVRAGPAGASGGLLQVLQKESRKESIMRKSKRLWRGIACGGLSLALVSGVGMPISAWAASNAGSEPGNAVTQHRQEFRAMHEKFLARAKAEDAALQKMIAELNQAPEAKKVDLEAAILTKLVAQHHQMLGEWEAMHARMTQWRNEHMQMSKAETSSNGMMHGMMGQNTASTQK